ncbi:MAG: AAA family ATPase [Alphaproteobacteria bacterium]|nr:AAA family ATPase [Alphaproteobacteria bacterium]
MAKRTMTRILVFGNAKGGTGKSTLALHTAIGLLQQGHRVAVLDLDPAQGTLTRYLENRASQNASLATPESLSLSPNANMAELAQAIADLAPGHDVLILDTPGSDTPLARAGHARADVLVTPLNDSFLDLDVLARVDPASQKITRISAYSEMVWRARQDRFKKDKGQIDWIVARNRLAQLDNRNARAMEQVLGELSKRPGIGFRIAPGLSERVIFRELFLRGLTLLDMTEGKVPFTMSHVTARQELRGLLDTLRI